MNCKNIFKKIAPALLASLLISACSDNSTVENITQVNQSGIDVISDVSKLPKCKKDNDGEMVWVKGEYAPRKCTNSKWYAVAEGAVLQLARQRNSRTKAASRLSAVAIPLA
ncbi:hypothetical protein [Fibrobacter sp.]|uniref:hypothetical protein n=1 Tax=Fibrobacter sp. TaxID=35828 RepID=UPI0025BD0A74|nr:hypothetical protein [Fibrobacter sp.]MBR3072862.1 hypothetical protein [Fibrobacter sp.]